MDYLRLANKDLQGLQELEVITGKSISYFCKKTIVDVRMGSKYASNYPLLENCPYSEFYWFVFSLNVGKYGPEKLRIRALFTQ